jgi:NADH-quinone oxidoreductase subunit N
LLGAACCSLAGLIASLIYLVIYVSMGVIFFSILLNLEHISSGQSMLYLSDLYSMTVDNSRIAKHIVIILLSMAGLPPFGGFVGKSIIYFAVIESRLEWLVFTCMALGVLTTYYYLSFIRHIFFEKIRFSKAYIYKTSVGINIIVNTMSFFIIFFIIILPNFYYATTLLAINCMFPLCQ